MLLQINRWIDPLADHLIIILKGPALAKDHSAWVIRTIRANTDAFSDAPAAARAVRFQITRLLLFLTYHSSTLISSSLISTLSTLWNMISRK